MGPVVVSPAGPDCRAGEPTLLDRFTIRGAADRRSSGSTALVTPDDADDVGLHHCADDGRINGARLLRSTTGDAGVVDQGVQAADPLTDQVGRRSGTAIVGYVQGNTEGIHPRPAQPGHRRVPPGLITRAHTDAHPSSPKPAAIS